MMSHKDKHPPTKKQQILARNKRHQLINEQVEFHEANRKAQAEFEAGVVDSLTTPTAPVGENGEVIWSAQLQQVRNRLTGKRRMASDRWNRFAGTEGGGGRGR